MVGLAPLAIVEAWERGVGGRAYERPLWVLGTALPDADWGALADLSIGARDAALLDVRSRLFGRLIEGTIACNVCGEGLELVFDVDDVRAGTPGEPVAATLELDQDGFSIAFRLPNSKDLEAIADSPDPGDADVALLDRCVLEAHRYGAPLETTALPDEVREALESAMAAADPQGDLEIETICPACASPQSVVFDAASFVWAELDAYARRLLRDVHELASAYGWPESEIWALSPARRAYYLEFVTE
jgi:hypothetical protein